MKGTHDDINGFITKIDNISRVFRSVISSLNKHEGQEQMDTCMQAYEEAFDGLDIEGKFVRQWKKILSSKVSKLSVL